MMLELAELIALERQVIYTEARKITSLILNIKNAKFNQIGTSYLIKKTCKLRNDAIQHVSKVVEQKFHGISMRLQVSSFHQNRVENS